MIERRQIDHTDLVQLGKTLLLLFKTEALLVDLPAMTQPIMPTEDSSKDPECSGVERKSEGAEG